MVTRRGSAGLGDEGQSPVRVALGFFEHREVAGVFEPFDPHRAGDVREESVRDGFSEVAVALTPEHEGGVVEPSERGDDSHGLGVVGAVELPGEEAA